MSDYAYVAERARKAAANVLRFERAVALEPERVDLQISLASHQKIARVAVEQFYRLAEINRCEICNYRLAPETESYPLPHIAQSLLSFQNLFSQVHDSVKNKQAKATTVVGREIYSQSLLEYGYAYSGSLGVALLARSERSFFDGTLDASIDALFDVIEKASSGLVRQVASERGLAVVKRLRDWSIANVEGQFNADVKWTKSNGINVGQYVSIHKMNNIIHTVDATSDEKIEELFVVGFLVGGDLSSSTFHFVGATGETYRGRLDETFDRATPMQLGHSYNARIRSSSVQKYATGDVTRSYDLLSLRAERPSEPGQ